MSIIRNLRISCAMCKYSKYMRDIEVIHQGVSKTERGGKCEYPDIPIYYNIGLRLIDDLHKLKECKYFEFKEGKALVDKEALKNVLDAIEQREALISNYPQYYVNKLREALESE